LTWFLGYLAISDARLPFQYAFTILNSLQGFFIFILFVLRKKRVRDQWLILCCCKTQEQEKVLRSLSASGSIPSTGSGRSSYSGRSERSDSTRTTTSFVNDSYDSLFFPFKSSRSSLYFREKSHSVTSEWERIRNWSLFPNRNETLLYIAIVAHWLNSTLLRMYFVVEGHICLRHITWEKRHISLHRNDK
jgi:hypothetical protein